MRKITGKVATFILAATITVFVSACTNSPFGPDAEGGSNPCQSVNGHIVCMGDF